MKRSQFLILAAIVPALFGLLNMLAPGEVRAILTVDVNAAVTAATRWYGFTTFSLGAINFLARSDPGSPALRAVMIGNIVFHVLAMSFQSGDYMAGLMSTSGLAMALLSHSLLAIGFAYFLFKLPRQQ
ncbi:MAG: hypothetical protein ABMA15_30010 [Vicinamibacterales bacterium]